MSGMIDWEAYYDFQMRLDRFWPAQSIGLPEDGQTCEEADRVLLAQRLLAGCPAEALPPALRDLPDADIAGASAWCELPLLVESGGPASAVPVLLGLLPCQDFPEIRIEQGWLNADAEEATRRALLVAGQGKQGFVLLRRDIRPEAGISGNSLGLPLAVAGRRLMQGAVPLPPVAMTGAIDEHGRVGSVGYVKRKHECARHSKRALFLYPEANGSELPPCEDALSVASLDSALALCGLESVTHGLARRIAQWRAFPQEFFAWMDSGAFDEDALHALPSLISLAKTEGWGGRFQDAEAMGTAVDRLYSWRDSHGREKDALSELLAFFPRERAEAAGMPPLQLLRLAGMNITLNNHRGLVQSPWNAIATRCCELVKDADPQSASEAIVAVVRSAFGAMQNAYKFREAPPEEWMQRVDEDTSYYRRYKSVVHLGKAYGTLAHRAAFLDSGHEALDCCQKSLDFWPDESNQQFRSIDRVYICLDMGRTEDAVRELRRALAICLHLPEGEDAPLTGAGVAKTDDAFVHAAFVRLCRAVPALFDGYPAAEMLAGLNDAPPDKPARNPWQCWANNCGRLLAGADPELARQCLRKAAGICLAENEAATLTPMALLPLSGLFHLRLDDEATLLKEAEAVIGQIRKLCSDDLLSGEHFQRVLEAGSAREALDIVEAEQALLFPFNYR